VRPRIAVLHQGFIPPYRKAFYELLDRRSDLEYVVFNGAPPRGSGHRAAAEPFDFPTVQVRNREVSVGGRTVIYQPLLRTLAKRSFSGAVVGAELRLASNVAAWTLMTLQRKPVILWGQGFEKAEDRGGAGTRLAAAGARLKSAAARRADGYLAYTQTGARQLISAGVPPHRIAVVRNTIDVESEMRLQEGLRDVDLAELRASRGLGASSLILLYVGRLYAEKRLPELIAALRELRAEGLGPDQLEAVILGDGPELDRVRGDARGVPGVHVMGAEYDPRAVAAYMRVAAALVIPGKVGLAANHAFAHGLPVITRESRLHAPEIEYVRHGENGLVVPGDERAFRAALLEFARSPSLRERLTEGALRTRSELTLEGMVSAFDAGVHRALERPRAA
jgi:glycosyltransferase involved in cell wall biosynthesis